MGRTVHYKVINPEDISAKDRWNIRVINNIALNPPLAESWTSEPFIFDSFGAGPNKNYPGFLGKTEEENVKFVEDTIIRYQEEGVKNEDIYDKLVEENIYDRYKNKMDISGTTEIFGNEKSADLIFHLLLKISEETDCIIRMVDEGRYLFAPILLKRGKVKIDVESFEAGIEEARKQGVLETNELGANDDYLEAKYLVNSFEDYTGATELFHRRVNWADFEQYSPNRKGEAMSGYRGEYWEIKESAQDNKDQINGAIFNEQHDSN